MSPSKITISIPYNQMQRAVLSLYMSCTWQSTVYELSLLNIPRCLLFLLQSVSFSKVWFLKSNSVCIYHCETLKRFHALARHFTTLPVPNPAAWMP